MTLISAENISLSYEGNRVIDSLSFCIKEGDYLCIVGENGSGKTTLLKAITGLKKADSGSLVVQKQLRQGQIGYLPQQKDFQKDFPASVKEVVLSGCVGRLGLSPFYKKEHKKRAADAMAQFGIENLAEKCYQDLSGGQKQKTLLARSVCAAKKLLVLDEPVTGLDENSTADMYSVISKLHSDGMTVVMISHDMASVERFATKVLYLGEDSHRFFESASEYAAWVSCLKGVSQ